MVIRIEGLGHAQEGFSAINFRVDEPAMFLNGTVTVPELEAQHAFATGGNALSLLVLNKIAERFTDENQDNLALLQLSRDLAEKDQQIQDLQEKLEEASKNTAIKLTEAITTMTMMIAMAGGEEEPLMPPMPDMGVEQEREPEPEQDTEPEPEPEQDTEPEPETEEQDEEEN